MAINGPIIALDQERAYDRIDDDYLWRVIASYSNQKNKGIAMKLGPDM